MQYRDYGPHFLFEANHSEALLNQKKKKRIDLKRNTRVTQSKWAIPM